MPVSKSKVAVTDGEGVGVGVGNGAVAVGVVDGFVEGFEVGLPVGFGVLDPGGEVEVPVPEGVELGELEADVGVEEVLGVCKVGAGVCEFVADGFGVCEGEGERFGEGLLKEEYANAPATTTITTTTIRMIDQIAFFIVHYLIAALSVK